MDALQERIKYTFKRPELLRQALTHSSHANLHGLPSSERLEYLGDSVVNFFLANEFFRLCPELNEGGMTKACAVFRSNKTLAQMAREIGLSPLIQFVRMPTLQEPSENMLADAFEALAGAIYLDSDMQTAQRVILDLYDFAEGKTYGKEVSLERA